MATTCCCNQRQRRLRWQVLRWGWSRHRLVAVQATVAGAAMDSLTSKQAGTPPPVLTLAIGGATRTWSPPGAAVEALLGWVRLW